MESTRPKVVKTNKKSFSWNNINSFLLVSIDSFFVDQQQLENRVQPVIVIKSSVRDIRLQCINKDSHAKWIQVRYSRKKQPGKNNIDIDL